MSAPEIAIIKSFQDGSVGVRIALRASGYGPSINMQSHVDIPSAEARAIAAELIVQADLADAKVKKKADAEARRKKWREREIEAGRMKVIAWRA